LHLQDREIYTYYKPSTSPFYGVVQGVMAVIQDSSTKDNAEDNLARIPLYGFLDHRATKIAAQTSLAVRD
jgi:hypothetical protein